MLALRTPTMTGHHASLLIALGLAVLVHGSTEAAPTASPYTERAASRGGTGKVYMGREIARPMSHRGAAWLTRPERLAEELPDTVVAQLELEGDDVVADIGAGTGYFVLRLAHQVRAGRVVAVDIQQEMLDRLQERLAAEHLTNVELVLGTETDPRLAPGTINLALLVNAYHEFSHPREMMRGVHEALEPGGRLVLVEYRADQKGVPIHPLHKMTIEQVRNELEAVGFRWVESRDFLPVQHFLVFTKP